LITAHDVGGVERPMTLMSWVCVFA